MPFFPCLKSSKLFVTHVVYIYARDREFFFCLISLLLVSWCQEPAEIRVLFAKSGPERYLGKIRWRNTRAFRPRGEVGKYLRQAVKLTRLW